MMRSSDIVAFCAAEFELDADFVSLTVRRLREADLFVRETRSPRSPRASARDCAHLLGALLADVPAVHAPLAVERLTGTRLQPTALEAIGALDLPDFVGFLKHPEVSFVDVVEGFVVMATKLGHGYEDCFAHTRFWVEKDSYDCGVELFLFDKDQGLPGPDSGQYWHPGLLCNRARHLKRRSFLDNVAIATLGRRLAENPAPRTLPASRESTLAIVAEALAKGLSEEVKPDSERRYLANPERVAAEAAASAFAKSDEELEALAKGLRPDPEEESPPDA